MPEGYGTAGRLIDLLSEGAALSQSALATSRSAEDRGAAGADDDSLGMREDSSNMEAARALDIHEEGVRRLYQSLKLVLGLFLGLRRVEEISWHFSENGHRFNVTKAGQRCLVATQQLRKDGKWRKDTRKYENTKYQDSFLKNELFALKQFLGVWRCFITFSACCLLLNCASQVKMTEEPLSPSHESLNFHVPAGQRACFFEELRPGHGRQIQAFVLAGGDVEITLNVYGPLEEGEILGETFDDPVLSEVVNAAKEKNSETQNVVIPFDASEQGHYAFCLDNRRSRFFPKFVQFDVSPLEAGSAEKAFTLSTTETQSAQQAAEGELQGALTVLHRIHKGIASIRMQQQRDRYRLDLHATMNENNYRHAFYGSLLETLIFILVAAFQIYFVRRWFASKGSRKPNRPWA